MKDIERRVDEELGAALQAMALPKRHPLRRKMQRRLISILREVRRQPRKFPVWKKEKS